MREICTSGSEGGGAKTLPTPILCRLGSVRAPWMSSYSGSMTPQQLQSMVIVVGTVVAILGLILMHVRSGKKLDLKNWPVTAVVPLVAIFSVVAFGIGFSEGRARARPRASYFDSPIVISRKAKAVVHQDWRTSGQPPAVSTK